MASMACPACGNLNPPGTATCPRCGSSLGPKAPRNELADRPSSFHPPPSAPPAELDPAEAFDYPQASFADTGKELKGLGLVGLAAILLLVSAILSWIPLAAGPFAVPQLYSGFYSGGSTVASPTNWDLYILLAAIAVSVGFFLGVIVWYSVFRAYRLFSTLDPGYRLLSTLTLLGLAGTLVLGVALSVETAAVDRYFTCDQANPGNTACVSDLYAYYGPVVALAAVGFILWIVGGFALIIGIWRFGTRYDESAFYAGAILLIFPVINIIGAILTLVGTRGASRKLRELVPTGNTRG